MNRLCNAIRLQKCDKILNMRVILASLARRHCILLWPTVSLHVPACLSPEFLDRCFRYAWHYLWNQLPSSFRQPHPVHSPPGSPHLAVDSSSQSLSSRSPSITLSAFHSRPICSTTQIRFCLVPVGLPLWMWIRTGLTGHWRLFVLLIDIFVIFGYTCPIV